MQQIDSEKKMEQTLAQIKAQLELEQKIGSLIVNGFTERGCEAYFNESGANVLFAKACSETNSYIQLSYNPENYPAYNIDEIIKTDLEMKDHIIENFDGWFCRKTQLDIPLTDGCVDFEADEDE